ncbi:MAG: hypothetical protein K9M99_02770 [Candidatus Cloacimonetes bacterium]|nr:hypothetical protein [Candidatus Cloacimonadota bacterium]
MLAVFILLLCIPLSAEIHTMSLDGTGDYISIQPAIDESVTGDTVLVEPGRYFRKTKAGGQGKTQKIKLLSFTDV